MTEIIQDKKNNLLHRQEIIIALEQKAIPSNTEVKKILAEQFKADEENIVIEKIGSKFGSRKFEISAKIYEDSESKEKYETLTKKERKKRDEEAKKIEETKPEEEKKEEQPAEETPLEEKTEEKSKETEEIKQSEGSEAPTGEPTQTEVKPEDAQPEKEPSEQPKPEKAKPEEEQ